MKPAKPVLVAAAAILDQHNRVLITQRMQGSHLAGKWEFPGGKCKPDESIQDALSRELKEELGITPTQAEHLITLTHHYPEKSVTLSTWLVRAYTGIEQGLEGQPLCWKNINDLAAVDFPEADLGIIHALQLPEFCAVTPDIDKKSKHDYLHELDAVLNSGIRLLILRCHSLNQSAYQQLSSEVVQLCKEYQAICMLNMQPETGSSKEKLNIHLTASRLMQLTQRPNGCAWLSASCHGLDEIKQAEKIGVDFILLSPVAMTASHPDAKVLGWEGFKALVKECNIPVYALGGMDKACLVRARDCGAQGVAGIRTFWSAAR